MLMFKANTDFKYFTLTTRNTMEPI